MAMTPGAMVSLLPERAAACTRLVALGTLLASGAYATSLCAQLQDRSRSAWCQVNDGLYASPGLIPSGRAALREAETLAVPAAPQPAAQPHTRLRNLTLLVGLLIVLAATLPLLAVLAIRLLAFDTQVAKCPNCGSGDVRVSFPETMLDRLLALASCTPCRCKVCYFRFYRESGQRRPVRLLDRLKVPTPRD